MKDRLDLWAGEFGNDYHSRNLIYNLNSRRRWLGNVLARVEHPVTSLVEFGCGTGMNLKAVRDLSPETLIYGVEPNRRAANIAMAHGTITEDSILSADFDDGEVDMALTCGVLIHIPPEGLAETMAKIHRVTKRYILCAEYFAPSEEEVPYHGETAALWRRDYGLLWLKHFPLGLKYVTHGFLWKPVDGLDNLTWWLFEKTGA
jgi:pseudaminic acid biosynthesis-associated methylase